MLIAFNLGILPLNLNHTFIALILKKKRSEHVADFRPISLCNVFYKLVTKVIANRLKTILPKIIFPTQSAFVPGWFISDNVLVA